MSLEDSVVILSSAITGFFAVMSAVLLYRYRRAAMVENESNVMARDLWDSLEARLKHQNGRILDIMARMEVMNAKAARQTIQPRLSHTPAIPKIREDVLPVVERKVPKTARRDIPETGMAVLRLLADGPMTSREIDKAIDRSREHTSRLLKSLFESGFVERETAEKPFVYRVTEEGRRYLEGGLR